MSVDEGLNIDELPVLLAGPVLRRLTRTKVSVWAALRVPGEVTLHVSGQGTTSTVSCSPVRIGRYLYVVLLTMEEEDGFEPDVTYEYWLRSSNPDFSPNWGDFSCGGAKYPTFKGLPSSVSGLRILHSSGRRPHANRRDGFAYAYDLLSEDRHRPHLLILTGDQIYADDVASVLMARIKNVATLLVDIDEGDSPLPPLPQLAGRQSFSESFGFTSEHAKDHLWTLGEYYAMYLLERSDVLWPSDFFELEPDGSNDTENEIYLGTSDNPNPQQNAEIWAEEVANLRNFKAALPDVRRVLANVPTLMLFDDHEITDDWNLDYNWIRNVYDNGAGRRVVTNAMLAYLIFQHWGNHPEPFDTSDTPEKNALAAAEWTGSSPDSADLRRWLSIPDITDIPHPLPSTGYDMRDLSTNDSIRYDFTLDANDSYPLRLVFLDERTARHFPEADKPCGRVATAALDEMWPAPVGNAADTPTLLVTPAPVLGVHIIEHVLQPLLALKAGGEAQFDFESWVACRRVYEHLLDRIGAYKKVIILSGDVHYSYTKSLSYFKPANTEAPARAAQFTASASKNAINLTVMLHWLGDLMQKLGIVRTRTFYGYSELSTDDKEKLEDAPPSGSVLPYDDIVDVMLGRVLRRGLQAPAVFSQEAKDVYKLSQPDWKYIIEHIDDEREASVGDLSEAMKNAADLDWNGWDADNSDIMIRGLRASDLHRLGRVFIGLPEISRVTLLDSETGLNAKQEVFISLGDDEATAATVKTVTEVNLG